MYAYVVAGRVLGVTIDMGMNYFNDDAGKRAARQRDAHIDLLFTDPTAARAIYEVPADEHAIHDVVIGDFED